MYRNCFRPGSQLSFFHKCLLFTLIIDAIKYYFLVVQVYTPKRNSCGFEKLQKFYAIGIAFSTRIINLFNESLSKFVIHSQYSTRYLRSH